MVYKIPYAGAEITPTTTTKKDIRPLAIPPCPESLRKLLFEVCRELDAHPNDVVSRSRTPKNIQAREEFIWRARLETDASFTRIAKVINKDHSTVVYHFQYRKARLNGANPADKWARKKPVYNVKEDPTQLNQRQEMVRSLTLRGFNKYEIAAELGVSVTIVKKDRKMIDILRPLPKELMAASPARG